MEQLYLIFGYLKSNHNSEMVFDPSEPNLEEEYFVREDWSHSVYGNKVEELQPKSFGADAFGGNSSTLFP